MPVLGNVIYFTVQPDWMLRIYLTDDVSTLLSTS